MDAQSVWCGDRGIDVVDVVEDGWFASRGRGGFAGREEEGWTGRKTNWSWDSAWRLGLHVYGTLQQEDCELPKELWIR